MPSRGAMKRPSSAAASRTGRKSASASRQPVPKGGSNSKSSHPTATRGKKPASAASKAPNSNATKIEAPTVTSGPQASGSQLPSFSQIYQQTCTKHKYPIIPIICSSPEMTVTSRSGVAAPNQELSLDLAFISKSQWKGFEMSLKAYASEAQKRQQFLQEQSQLRNSSTAEEPSISFASSEQAESNQPSNSLTRPHFQRIHLCWNKMKDYSMFRELPTLSKSGAAGDNPKKTADILKHYDYVQSARAQMSHQPSSGGRSRGRSSAVESSSSSKQDLLPNFDVSAALRLANMLSQYLITESLVSFRMEGFSEVFNAQVWKIIASALKAKCTTSLRELSLAGSRIGDEGFKPVGILLKYLKRMEHLNLSGCHISNQSIKAVVNLIKVHQEIVITDNWIGSLRDADEGEYDDESYESGIRGLFSVNLSNNFFTDYACKLLSKYLMEECTMRMLNLNSNIITENGIEMLEDCLVRSTVSKIASLYVGDNPGTTPYILQCRRSGRRDTVHSTLYAGEASLSLCAKNAAKQRQRHEEQVIEKPQRSKIQRKQVTRKRSTSTASNKSAEHSRNQTAALEAKIDAHRDQIEQLEVQLENKTQENEQLREIIKDMYEKMRRMKEKRKKEKLRASRKMRRIAQDIPQKEGDNASTTSDSSIRKEHVVKSAAHDRNSNLHHRISEGSNTDPALVGQEPIDYAGLSLADIEKQLAQVDKNDLPQYEVIQSLAQSVKQLTKMVDDLEGTSLMQEVDTDVEPKQRAPMMPSEVPTSNLSTREAEHSSPEDETNLNWSVTHETNTDQDREQDSSESISSGDEDDDYDPHEDDTTMHGEDFLEAALNRAAEMEFAEEEDF